MPIPLALLALPAIAQAGLAVKQLFQNKKPGAPIDATVPAAYQERINRLKMQEALGAKLPGQDLMENKLTASTASGIDATRKMGNQATFSNTVAQFVQQEQDKLAEIGIAGAKRKDELSAATNDAIKDLEGYQQNVQARKMEIGDAEINRYISNKGAAYQNLFGAATSAASLAATMGAGAGAGAAKGAGAAGKAATTGATTAAATGKAAATSTGPIGKLEGTTSGYGGRGAVMNYSNPRYQQLNAADAASKIPMQYMRF